MIATELGSVTWTEKGKLMGVGAHDDICVSLWLACTGAQHASQVFSFGFI